MGISEWISCVRSSYLVGVGGLALVLSNALSAVVELGGIVPTPVAFGRLLLGAMGKWLVAIAVLAAALAIWRLPPLPGLVGLVAGLLAYLLALRSEASRVGKECVSKCRDRWAAYHK